MTCIMDNNTKQCRCLTCIRVRSVGIEHFPVSCMEWWCVLLGVIWGLHDSMRKTAENYVVSWFWGSLHLLHLRSLFCSTNKKSVLFWCPALRALEHKRGKNAFILVTLTLYPKPRAQKFSKNPGLSSKFRVSEGWLDEHSILTTGVVLEPHSYMVISVWCLWTDNVLWYKGKDAIITLKMLGTTIWNAFNHVVRHLGYVHFCPSSVPPELELGFEWSWVWTCIWKHCYM